MALAVRDVARAVASMIVELATDADAGALTALHSAVAGHLTRQFGHGHWSSSASEAGVVRNMRGSRVIVARDDEGIAGTARLTRKKPWAIDPNLFTPVATPLYLVDMAVRPSVQRTGIGRRLIEETRAIAKAWPAAALRLDAYDAPAGAGAFYAKCGFREVGRAEYRKVPLVYYEMLIAQA